MTALNLGKEISEKLVFSTKMLDICSRTREKTKPQFITAGTLGPGWNKFYKKSLSCGYEKKAENCRDFVLIRRCKILCSVWRHLIKLWFWRIKLGACDPPNDFNFLNYLCSQQVCWSFRLLVKFKVVNYVSCLD